MKVKYDDLEQAYEFVSSAPYGENSALLDSLTGQIYWHSDFGDFDEIPEEVQESDDTIEIPHKNDLDLGQQLVFDFVDSHIPQHAAHVHELFSQRGAYSRYKGLLEMSGLLQEWYAFEQRQQEDALRQWAKEYGIELTDEQNAESDG